jgi:hypothetical protein
VIEKRVEGHIEGAQSNQKTKKEMGNEDKRQGGRLEQENLGIDGLPRAILGLWQVGCTMVVWLPLWQAVAQGTETRLMDLIIG